MKFHKSLLIVEITIAISILTSCSTLLAMPWVSIDNHLGDNQIGKELDRVAVWSGISDYHRSKYNPPTKKEDTEIYQMIKSEIENSKKLGGDINTTINATLTNSDLGVICKNNECRYHGYYIRTVHNVPKANSPTGKLSDRGDVYLSFNPYNLQSTYKVEIINEDIPE